MKLTNELMTEVIQKCFTQKEIEVFQITNNDEVICTPADQFISVYSNRCYIGTKENLIKDFAYIKSINQHKLNKLQDIQENIKRLLNPFLYADLTLRGANYTSSSGSTSKSTNDTTTDANSYDSSISDTQNISSTININQSGTSESNDIDPIDNVIKELSSKPNLKKIQLNVDQETKKFEKENEPYTEKNIEFSKPPIKREFQNLAYEQSNSIDTTNSFDYGTSVSGDKTVVNNIFSNIGATSTGGNRNENEYKINENKARIEAWRLQLPKIKEEFILAFEELFCHAYRY